MPRKRWRAPSSGYERGPHRLQQASHKLAEAMYKATPARRSRPGASGGGPQPGANGAAGRRQKKDDGVIDAEYVDVDEKK